MKFDHQKFWKATPQIIDVAIALVFISVGAGIGLALSRSQKVALSPQGVVIEQQAIATQKDLERSLLIIKIYQVLVEKYESDIKEFSRRYEAGQELAEQAQFAAEVIPPQQIKELEQNIRESRQILDETLH